MSDISWDSEASKASDGISWDSAPSTDVVWESASKTNPTPADDWGTKDARDFGVSNHPPKKYSVGEKIGASFQNAVSSNKYLSRDTGQTQALQAKRLRDSFERNPYLKTPEREAEAARLQKDAQFRLSKYLILRESMQADEDAADPNMAEKLAGSLIPSLFDELNLVPIGKGAKLVTTMAKGTAGGLALGIVSAYEAGQHDKAMGLIKKDPEFAQLLESGFDTAMIVAAISSAMHIRGNFHAGKYDRKPSATAKTAEAEARAVLDQAKNVNTKAGLDASSPNSPYTNPKLAETPLPPGASLEMPPDATRLMRQNDLTPTNIKNASLYNEYAEKKGLEQVPGISGMEEKINPKEYNKPYWPDQELQDAIKKANHEAQVRENFGDEYPSDDLARGDPTQAEKLRDPLAQQTPDEATAALEVAKIDAQEPRNPFIQTERGELPPDAVSAADPNNMIEAQKWADQHKPGFGEMDIPPEAGNVPFWADSDLEKAKAAANRVGGRRTGGPVDISREGSGMTADSTISPEVHKQIDDHIAAALKPEAPITPRGISKKEGGWVDMSEQTGTGFTDLVEVTKKAAGRLWSVVPSNFKTKFKDAWARSKDGTPSIMFHGTNKVYDKYNPDLNDGAMVHVGTIDSASIIKDSSYKNSTYIYTNFPYGHELHDVLVPSFKEFLLDQVTKPEEVLNLSSAKLKEFRNNWYQYKDALLKDTIKQAKRVIDDKFPEFEATIRKAGTERIRDAFKYTTAEVLNHIRHGENGGKHAAGYTQEYWHELYLLRAELEKHLHDIGLPSNPDYLHNGGGFYSKDLSVSLERLKNYAVEQVTNTIENHGAGSNFHIRPLWTNIKNPLFIGDMGRFDDLRATIEELLPKSNPSSRSSLSGTDLQPLKPQQFLGEEKGKQFTRDLIALMEKHPTDLGVSRSHFKEFFKVLEKYGFDSIAYENRAEAMQKSLFTDDGQPSQPVISLGIWNPNLIHDLVDVPRGVSKKEGGWIDRGAAKKLTTREDVPEGQELVERMVPKTAQEAVDMSASKDIGEYEQLIPMTANQQAQFFQHPVITFAYDKMREFHAEANVRFNHYKAMLGGIEGLIKHDRSSALQMFKVLADIQDPELKKGRQQAEDMNMRAEFLIEHGLPENLVPHAIIVLDVMKHIGMLDQQHALKYMGHNWHMDPMYFPREHTGAYTVSVTDMSGKPIYMRGFDSAVAANQYAAKFRDQAKNTGYTVELSRNEVGSLGDVYTMLNLSADNLPPFLKGINDKLLKEIEVSRRKFEMERSPDKVAGYTGETIYNAPGGHIFHGWKYMSDTKLLTLLQRRMEQSYQLETKGRALKELKEPLLDDPSAMHDMPRAAHYLHQTIARELGLSISKFHVAGKAIDKVANSVGKSIDKLAGAMHGYKGGEVSIFKPDELARLGQIYTWTMSMFKLGLSPATLVANTSTLMAVPADGFRTAFREGVNPMVANLATLKSLIYAFDPEAQAFMKQAKLEGMVEPRISDPLTLTYSHSRAAADRVVNAPRDIIEKATNFTTLQYYYNFYKLARPDLDPKSQEFKTKVYEATRSWTGDYTQQAQLLYIDQAGGVGTLFSNFAKWKFNQVGRLMNDLKDLKDGKPGAFASTFMTTIIMAGLAGAPVIAEYEAIRQFGVWTGAYDLKPLNAMLYDGKDWIKKNLGNTAGELADMAIKSPITTGVNEAFKAMGLTSGPDIAGNLRFSSVLEANTLPLKFPVDVWKTLSGGTKQMLYYAGIGNGATDQQLKESVKGLPTVIANPLEEFIENKITQGDPFKPNYVDQFSSQDKGSYRQAPEEKAMQFGGFTSAKQREEMTRVYGKEWKDRYEKKQLTKNIELFVARANDPAALKEIAKDIYDVRGVEGVNEAIEAITKRKIARAQGYYEQEVQKALGSMNPTAQARALDALKNFRPSK